MIMITITSATAKRDLLEKLATQANNYGKLIVDVDSLPTFLTTPIAFTIFTYQISNYPRHIAWTSENPNILEFLKTCQVEVILAGDFSEDNNNISTSYAQIIPSNQIIEIEAESSKPLININPFEEVENQLENSEVQTIGPASYPKLQAIDLFKKDFNYSPSSLLDIGFAEESVKLGEIKKQSNSFSKPQFFVQPNPDLTKPSQVIEEKDLNTDKKIATLQNNLEQNLDSWLERIENTRQALNSIKSVEQKKVKKPNFFIRSFQFSIVTAILSSVVLGMWTLFPTNVYSLNVVPDKKEKSSQLTLSPSRFLSQNRNLNTTGEIEASGKEMINLSQARGKVTIVNRSGGSVSFNRSGIILVGSNGLEYKHVPVNGEPGTFTVPERSDLSGENLTINIEASGSGSNYNLPKDSTLKVLNLRRDLIGSLLQAVVSEEVSITKETGKKVVQAEDLKKLEDRSNQKIQELVKPEIQSIKNEDTYADPSWYSLQDIKHIYTRNIGDIADTIGITSTTKAKIYYLNKSLLEDELKLTVADLKRLVEIKSIDYDGSDFGKIDKPITLNLNYIYSQKIELNESELATKLANDDFSKAKDDLQQNYPQIKDIQKKEQGVRLPGVPARVNVSINQKD